jgi:hypothetical protein
MVGRQRRRRELDDLPTGPSDDDLLQWGRELAGSGSFWGRGNDDLSIAPGEVGPEPKVESFAPVDPLAAPEPVAVEPEAEPEPVAVEPEAEPEPVAVEPEAEPERQPEPEPFDPVAWLAEEVLPLAPPRAPALRWAERVEPWEHEPLALAPEPAPHLVAEPSPASGHEHDPDHVARRREPIRAGSGTPARPAGARSAPLVARGRRVRPVIRTSSAARPSDATGGRRNATMNGGVNGIDRPIRTEPLRPTVDGVLQPRLSELDDA